MVPGQVDAVELGRVEHGDFVAQFEELVIQRALVGRTDRAVGRLDGEFAHALQHVADLVQRAFRGLHQRDAVQTVAVGLFETADLAVMRSEIARPAASSLARLMRRPRRQTPRRSACCSATCSMPAGYSATSYWC